MKSKTADVVIIGGGLAGLACGYFCAKAGITGVVVLERDGIFSKASSATLGSMCPSLAPVDRPDYKILADRGFETLKKISEGEDVDLEYETKGHLIPFWTEDEAERAATKVSAEQQAGYISCLIDQKELRQLEPELTKSALGAIYRPNEAHVNPLKLAAALYERSKQMGVIFHTYTKVTGFKHKGQQITTVFTERGGINTSIVINAAGAWASEISKLMGANITINPVRGQAVVTEPVPAFIRNMVLDKIAVQQHQNGGIFCGGTHEWQGFDSRTTYEVFVFLCREMVRLFPKLRHIKALRTWAGLRPSAPDGLPVIGEMPLLKSAYIVAGLSSAGLLFSAIGGKLVAELIALNLHDPLLDVVSSRRFANADHDE